MLGAYSFSSKEGTPCVAGVRGTPIIDRGVKARQVEVRNVTLNNWEKGT